MYLDKDEILLAIMVLLIAGAVLNEIARWFITRPRSKKLQFDNKLERIEK